MKIEAWLFPAVVIALVLLVLAYGAQQAAEPVEATPAAFKPCVDHKNPCGHHDCGRDRTRIIA